MQGLQIVAPNVSEKKPLGQNSQVCISADLNMPLGQNSQTTSLVSVAARDTYLPGGHVLTRAHSASLPGTFQDVESTGGVFSYMARLDWAEQKVLRAQTLSFLPSPLRARYSRPAVQLV